MAIIRRDGWLWNIFSSWLGLRGFEGGEIILSHGYSVVNVPTCNKGRRIWISVDEPNHSIPVCCGDINLIGSKITDNGFTICADIKTDMCIVQWFLEY
jgi:hypothetical protein